MVHALQEIHRILKPNGTLIDLRVLEDSWSVEIASSSGWQAAGTLEALPAAVADDEAANLAMREAKDNGWYIQKTEAVAPYFYYWDTPSEMKAFMEREWQGFEKLREDVYRKTATLWAISNADARVRVRMQMLMATWEKRQP